MAKGAPEPQQQQGGDRSLDFLWLIVLIVGSFLLLWYFGKTYIAMIVFTIKLYEIDLIYFVMGYWGKLIDAFGFPLPNLSALTAWTDFIHKSYGATVDFSVLANLSTAVGKYLRFPVMIALTLMGVTLYFGSSSQRFRRVYNMQQLKFEERSNWPQITPVIDVDLLKAPLDDPPWAMAQDPMRFCKKYHLINEEIRDGKTLATLRHGAAYRVLSLQVGPRWRGINALPNYLQALIAIFATRIAGDKRAADDLVEKIAASSSKGKIEFFNTKELLLKHLDAKPVAKIIRLHGYVTTVMASLLAASREAGVLSTSEFIWLKPMDRRMWYMMNSVGRYTAVSEIVGAFAHWQAERKLGLPLMTPMVEEAVKGLEIALSEILYKPEEP